MSPSCTSLRRKLALSRDRAASGVWSFRGVTAPPRGVTLIELLVVITLIMIVTAAAIPVMAPAIQSRRVREASRLMSSYLAAARSRAIETGRPVGVMIQRFPAGSATPQTPVISMNLAVAESQPPYAGDFTGSTANLIYNTTLGTLQITGFPNGDAVTNQHIRIGDYVQLNYQGPRFVIYNSASVPTPNTNGIVQYPTVNAPWNLYTENNVPYLPTPTIPQYATNSPTGPPTPVPLPFQILRQPVRSSADPLQLPEGIVIDLQWSGMSTATNGINGNSGVFAGATDPIISFQPSGAVGLIYDVSAGNPNPAYPTGPIYLLLGRNEQVNPLTATTQNNLSDLNSLWITVNNQTGQVGVNANYNPSNAFLGTSGNVATTAQQIVSARTLASGSLGPVTTLGGN